jgi:hypothetical protein
VNTGWRQRYRESHIRKRRFKYSDAAKWMADDIAARLNAKKHTAICILKNAIKYCGNNMFF